MNKTMQLKADMLVLETRGCRLGIYLAEQADVTELFQRLEKVQLVTSTKSILKTRAVKIKKSTKQKSVKFHFANEQTAV